MTLLLPDILKKDINSYSRFLQYGTKYANKSVKGLFLLKENQQYLGNQIYSLLTSANFIADNIEPSLHKLDYNDNRDIGVPNDNNININKSVTLASDFRKHKKLILSMIPHFVEGYLLPYPDEMTISNPVMQLHHINKKFIIETAKNLIQSPEVIIHNYYDINPDTGLLDNYGVNAKQGELQYEYRASSYSSGTWQPEKLFTDSQRNRENPYWLPVEVNFHSGRDNTDMEAVMRGMEDIDIDDPGISEGPIEEYSNFGNNSKANYHIKNIRRSSKVGYKTGPGHKYQNNVYGEDGFSKGGKFPAWQYYPQYRHYETNTGESLFEGGISDRRVQSTRGYNMNALLQKPSLSKYSPQNPPGDVFDKPFY